MPRVSVVTPVRNGGRLLAAALRSIDRQTYEDWEHVVVDDGSTDGTADVLAAWESPKHRLVRFDEPRGVAEAINAGLQIAQGELVARLDADDVALPTRLARQVGALDRRPSLALLGSAAVALDAAGRRRGLVSAPVGVALTRWRSLFSSPVITSAAVFRRDALGADRFDPAFTPSEDFDMWARIVARRDADNLAAPLVCYRFHAGQLSDVRSAAQLAAHTAIVRRSLASAFPDVEVPEELVEGLWRLAVRRPVAGDSRPLAELLLALHAAFRLRFGDDPAVRRHVAAALAAAGHRARARELDPRVGARVWALRAAASARALRYRVGAVR